MKYEDYKNLLTEDEKIIEIFIPESLLKRLVYFIRKRTALIITNKRVIYRGNFEHSDKEVLFRDISDAYITDTPSLEIFKKGGVPVDDSVIAELLVPPPLFAEVQQNRGYISINWLSKQERQEALAIIKKEEQVEND